jgi:hypothetical protein
LAIVVVVTNVGLGILTNALEASGLGTVYLAVGTGAGVANVTDTAMSNEDTTTGRIAVTLSRTTTSVTNDTVTATVTVSFPVVNETVTETGLWTASSGGTLIYHRTGISQLVGPTAGVPSVQFIENIQF